MTDRDFTEEELERAFSAADIAREDEWMRERRKDEKMPSTVLCELVQREQERLYGH